MFLSKGGSIMDSTFLTDMQYLMANFWYLFLVAPLLPAIISGILTSKLAAKKGFYGYFFTGFFFNLFESGPNYVKPNLSPNILDLTHWK